MEKQQASACGPGCGCNATGTPGKTRWVIGVIVLVAAGVLVARDIIKSDAASAQTSEQAFALPIAAPTNSNARLPQRLKREWNPSGRLPN
jgi:MYXO-CTERM domain-containing protein